ncbi:deoxyuridine 5'-triphosphate nucleotidohydrolase [bacterium]|nr:deoxyuridine 5'-triphosphate nucleotidohydrolase [bacterium]
MILATDELKKLLRATPPLMENLPDPERQLTTNGLDLTVAEVERFIGETPGSLDFDNSARRLPETEPLPWKDDSLLLPPGGWLIRYAEKVNLPRNIIALGKPRSSLLRMGATLPSAVWDAGYSGYGQGLLVVHHPAGLLLHRRARVLQLVFHQLSSTTTGYQGVYQGEG